MFPSTATAYVMRKGKATQNCSFSRPGMPTSRKQRGWEKAGEFGDVEPSLPLAYTEGSCVL